MVLLVYLHRWYTSVDDIRGTLIYLDVGSLAFELSERCDISTTILEGMRSTITKLGTEKEGCIMWLKYDKVSSEWFNSNPKVFDYIDNVS
jgi:hypothetical protein